ncbi:restriction endonuclease subunit S [Pseudovibrio sp. Ad37]|uniref:restriction endonuclease subunit S n=1 Tax=Pseudovibrio sp. Ad37 TaxID=989422 RepID=UPI0007AEB8AB|nr:restriction endonuclease subunit S [Pseudovibrio sp. Ad37]KZL21974.1 EcoKI restriction-modification system protein HsdS [Pseudovibrio sp. Ad37]
MAGKYKAYPAYKESGLEWLGEIPNGWGVKRLKHLASIRNGQDYKQIEAESGYPVLGSGGQFTYAAKPMYCKESVLLGRKGTIDRPLYINEPFWTVDTMYYTEVSPDTPAKFLYYLATTIQFDRYSTNTALPSMTQEHLGNYSFAIPKRFTEQQQIARFLDHETLKIDRLIERQERLIGLLEEKRQAVISHAVTKGLNPDAPLRPSGIDWLGDVPEHWDATQLKHLFLQSKRQDHPDLEVLSVYRDFGVIKKSSRDDNNNKTPEDLTSYQLIEVGDLVINKMKAWQGSLGVSTFKGITSPDYVVYRAIHSEHSQYIHFALRCKIMPDVYKSISNGIRPSQWRLEPEKFEKLSLTLPPYKEQKEIAAFLVKSDSLTQELVSKAKSAITLLKERRTALISAAVTGKIDVRDWEPPKGTFQPAEESASLTQASA